MEDHNGAKFDRKRLLRRFWESASGFWCGPGAWRVWFLCALLLATAVFQLITQYQLNYWNRDFFNAIERKDTAALAHAVVLFFPLAGASTALAILSVWGRMTAQRNWRKYLTSHLINAWLADGRYRHLIELNGTDSPRNPEHRIAEDARVATDAPIDLVLSLFASILAIFTFFEILASVGGALTIEIDGLHMVIPSYLAIAVVAYSGLVTGSMLWIGRRLTSVVQDLVQAEAVFRSSANLIRESGEGILVMESESNEVRALWADLSNVIERWRQYCWQLMRTTFVTHGNTLLTPTVGLILCVPKYLSGEMSLGEVTQVSAAFVMVQSALNWFVDNYQRIADTRSAANRVAALLLALDKLTPSAASAQRLTAPGTPAPV